MNKAKLIDPNIESTKSLTNQNEDFFAQFSAPMLLLDKKFKIQNCNSAFVQFFGYEMEELLGQDFDIIGSQSSRLSMGSKSKEVRRETIEFRCKNGAKVARELLLEPLASSFEENSNILAIFQEVPKKTPLIHKQVQVDRLKTIGSLVDGIAHDFNNILTPIYGYANLALDNVDAEDRNYERLVRIAKGANLAKRLVRQILDFSRESDDLKSNIQLARLLEKNISLLRATMPDGIEIIADITPQSAPIYANQVQIDQMIENLCDEAILRLSATGGQIQVTLDEVVFAEGDNIESPAENILGEVIRSGCYVRLSVRDSGSFAADDNLSDLVDPVSGVEDPDGRKGLGTNLGMATIYKVLVEHQGTFELNMANGFMLSAYIPISDVSEEHDKVENVNSEMFGSRILFVDDVQENAEVAIESLETMGYSVMAFTNGIDALEFAKSSIDDFDLVITDQAMPNMTGDVLAGEIKKLKPEIPIILTTGFSARVNEDNYKELGFFAIVMKPWLMSELNLVIQRALTA
ncbi:MAG: response regulator [Rhodospirillaceae bacterium]|nr:response regulator [Rhodospirillaceae bacterium]